METERIPLADATGRVLAEPVVADRASPPHDASAMDGYALRLADAQPGVTLPVAGRTRMGGAPPPLAPGTAVQITTGAAVPVDAELVVKREDTDETVPGRVTLRDQAVVRPGLSIRRAGENAPAGATIAAAGATVTPGLAAAAATYGAAHLRVRRRVRLVVLVTGDEFSDDATPPPWQIRECNGVAAAGWSATRPHVELLGVRRVPDLRAATVDALDQAAQEADLVLTTGGVSMGDGDHVPHAAVAAGFEAAYHRVAMRPGKPNLGAVHPGGAVLLGLPGNPVSVLCGLTRFAGPVAARLAGATPSAGLCVAVEPGHRPPPIGLWQYHPAARSADGRAVPLPHRGSGDTAALAAAELFLETPPGTALGAEAPAWAV